MIQQVNWSGYDEWRVHGNTHKCGDCGNTWQDFEGGCTYCADREEDEEEEEECHYCGGSCPEEPANSKYLCDGFSGDIDGLYAEGVKDDESVI